MSKRKVASIWQCDAFIEVDSNYARCQLCNAMVSRSNYGTTAMINHLDLPQHEHLKAKYEETEKRLQQEKEEEKKKQRPLNDYFKKSDANQQIVVDALICCNIPPKAVENVTFKRFAETKIELKGETFYRQHIDEAYFGVRKLYNDRLNNIDHVACTTDTKKMAKKGTLMTLTAHGINNKWKREHLNLDCSAVHLFVFFLIL